MSSREMLPPPPELVGANLGHEPRPLNLPPMRCELMMPIFHINLKPEQQHGYVLELFNMSSER